jgi:hypothetical protein
MKNLLSQKKEPSSSYLEYQKSKNLEPLTVDLTIDKDEEPQKNIILENDDE